MAFRWYEKSELGVYTQVSNKEWEGIKSTTTDIQVKDQISRVLGTNIVIYRK